MSTIGQHDRSEGGAHPCGAGGAGFALREKPFGREHRLRTRSQLDYVRAHGRRRVGSLLVVAAVTPPDGQRRVTTVVSRRFSRKAVARNRARRLMREAYRLLLPVLEPAWLVLIPRRWILDVKMEAVLDELRRLTSALGLHGQKP